MQLIEETYTLLPDGSLHLPASNLLEMGMRPGEAVTVAYLSGDDMKNRFHEFMIGGLHTDNDAPVEIRIPSELLQNAGLSSGENLNIVCLNGCILICRDATLTEQELYTVMDSLGIAEDIICSLDDRPEKAVIQLTEEFCDIVEGELEKYGMYD